MTRINADLHPSKLLDQHLMAEYRELPMVYAALRRSMRSKSINSILMSVPEKFTLNAGHVKFFYDKLGFLQKRYAMLIVELKERRYNIDNERQYNLEDIPDCFKKDWVMQPRDKDVIVERILTRYNQKPSWYKYRGANVDQDFVISLLES